MSALLPPPDKRRFLLLQGPHGPFFAQLGTMLRAAGAQVWRVGFNLGDRVFWPMAGFIPYRGPQEDWPQACAALLDQHEITDLVLYGDTRPIHRTAIAQARARGITVHVFEEGYLRPYWITYERGGANGHSRLMDFSLAQMQSAIAPFDMDLPDAPARWGAMRAHVFWGALYHWFVLTGFWAFRHFRPHRSLSVRQEFALYLRRMALMLPHRWERMLATRAIQRGGFPYHLVLLQLEHDASFQMHSPFADMDSFLKLVIEGFAKGAPAHHHIVFKAHPLEDGRAPIARSLRRLAKEYGLGGRVHFVRGSKLAALLNNARSCVTVNSTAAQQALWRGLPVKCFGAAVYDKPEFVSDLPLAEFFTKARRPDSRAYRDYRHFLLETSQVQGSFYSAKGRREVLRQIVDMMLQAADPYDALAGGAPAPRLHLRVVS